MLNAKWGNVTRDSDGNITNAGIVCDRACQKEGAAIGRFNSHDIARAAIRISYLRSQTTVAQGMGQAAEYGSLISAGVQFAAYSVAKWAFMSSSQKVASFFVLGDGATLAVGGTGAVVTDTIWLGLYQNAKTLIPRMRLAPTAGKPKIRLGPDGKPRFQIDKNGVWH